MAYYGGDKSTEFVFNNILNHELNEVTLYA